MIVTGVPALASPRRTSWSERVRVATLNVSSKARADEALSSTKPRARASLNFVIVAPELWRTMPFVEDVGLGGLASGKMIQQGGGSVGRCLLLLHAAGTDELDCKASGSPADPDVREQSQKEAATETEEALVASGHRSSRPCLHVTLTARGPSFLIAMCLVTSSSDLDHRRRAEALSGPPQMNWSATLRSDQASRSTSIGWQAQRWIRQPGWSLTHRASCG